MVDMAKLLRRYIPVTESGCWIWTGYTTQHGYAQMQDYSGEKRRKLYIHRLSYLHFKGPIPPRFTIDHLCRVRCCINPDHLEAVSIGENVLRGDSESGKHKRQTHCKNGHPLVPGNLAYLATRPRARICLICKRNTGARYHAKKRRLQNQLVQMEVA